MPAPACAYDPLDLLTAPGGRGALRRDGSDLVAGDGRRFPIRDGIIEMLGPVSDALRVELAAQAAAEANYLDQRLFMTQYERDVVTHVLSLLGDAEGPFLDPGCGIGLVGRHHGHLRLYGIDASRCLLRHAGPGYVVRVHCNVEELPFPDASFGTILAVNMLHHVERPAAAVAEFARVLRPGGALVSADPRKVAAVERVKQVLRRNDANYAPTHGAFGVREYRDLLAGAHTFMVEHLECSGLTALLVGAGLDALNLHRVLPTTSMLTALRALDRLIERSPAGRACGLNLYARARRVR
ncbi:MAG TPA: methyltransferase domain-containing protein [Polyangia bacterium]